MKLLASCQATLRGDSNGVSSLTISPDGRLLVGGMNNGTIRLWRLPDGEVLTTLTGHTYSVTGVVMSPDGRMLASVSSSSTVRLWSLPEGTALKTLDGAYNIASWPSFSSDGHFLAIGEILFIEKDIAPWFSMAVRSCKTETGVRILQLPHGTLQGKGRSKITMSKKCLVYVDLNRALHPNTASSIVFGPSLRVLACGLDDGTVGLYRWTDEAASHGSINGVVITLRKAHTAEVTCIVMSSDTQLLASGSKDTTIGLWKRDHVEALYRLEGHTREVTSVAMSPIGRILASGSCDRTVRLWSLANGEALQTLEGHTDEVTCVAMSPDGHLLASGSRDGTVRLWDCRKVV